MSVDWAMASNRAWGWWRTELGSDSFAAIAIFRLQYNRVVAGRSFVVGGRRVDA
jgi:hypothetical protein